MRPIDLFAIIRGVCWGSGLPGGPIGTAKLPRPLVAGMKGTVLKVGGDFGRQIGSAGTNAQISICYYPYLLEVFNLSPRCQ